MNAKKSFPQPVQRVLAYDADKRDKIIEALKNGYQTMTELAAEHDVMVHEIKALKIPRPANFRAVRYQMNRTANQDISQCSFGVGRINKDLEEAAFGEPGTKLFADKKLKG